MASRGFFNFDPFDAFLDTFGSYNAPYTQPYGSHRYQQPAAARRAQGSHWIDDFFPYGRPAAEPEAARARPASRSKTRKPAEAEKSVPIQIRVDGPDPKPKQERKAAASVPRKGAPSAEEAAVRLQARARGLLARKSFRAVRRVHAEALAAWKTFCGKAEVLRRDEGERAAAGEVLMKMLLRLDSVRGARGYRRKITKLVIAMQDAVEALGKPKAAVADPAEETVQAEAAEEETVQVEAVAAKKTQTEEVEAAAAKETQAEEVEEVAHRSGTVQADEAVAKETLAEEVEVAAQEIVQSEVVAQEGAPEAAEHSDQTAVETTAAQAAVEPIGEMSLQETTAAPDATEHSAEIGNMGEADMPTKMEADTPTKMDDEGSMTVGEAYAEAKEEEGDKPEGSSAEGEWEMVPEAPPLSRLEPVMKKILIFPVNEGSSDMEKMVATVVALSERNTQQSELIAALTERVDALECTVRRMEEDREATRTASSTATKH